MHWIRRGLAEWLAAQSLHEFQTTSSNSVIKRRRIRSHLLIPCGNLYLRLAGAMSEAVPSQLWIEWERAIASLTGKPTPAGNDPAVLEVPIIPGVSLLEVLRSDIGLDIKLRSISWAAAALRSLHRWRITACGVSDWPLSHGDATCGNVIIDDNSQCATWIDFDMRHRSALPLLCRQADDLRTLIASSARWLDRSNYSAVVETVFNSYEETDVITEMRRFVREWRYPNIFNLAQAPLNLEEFHFLREVIGRG